MKSNNGRTPEQIRTEIAAERGQLEASLASLGAEVKRSGTVAGGALAAAGSAWALVKLRRRRRR